MRSLPSRRPRSCGHGGVIQFEFEPNTLILMQRQARCSMLPTCHREGRRQHCTNRIQLVDREESMPILVHYHETADVDSKGIVCLEDSVALGLRVYKDSGQLW